MRRALGLVLAASLVPALAQDPPAPATDDSAAPAPTAAPVKPRPAMLAPLAARTTLLGIAGAGERLVAVGQRGHVVLSDDGGRNWRQVAVPVDAMLNRVRFRDAKAGWAVGHDAAILATRDGGETWALQHFDAESRALYDILFLDGQRLVALGAYGTYLVSSNDGAHWERQSSAVTELGQHFNAATRLADGTLLIAGERGLLARSKDNAATWELLDSPYTGSFFGVLPAGDRGALVFGLRGNIYVATDIARCPRIDPTNYDPYARETVSDAAVLAKLGWTPLTRPTTEGLFGGAADGARALLVGVNGVVVRVDAAAKTAVLLKAPAPETLNDVLRHGDRWLAVGRRGAQDLGALE
jgi:hypothetical protein